MKAARLRSRVTYANVTATLALALALSTGGAYAAAQIGAGDIKDDAVRTRHIADGHVTTNDLKDGAVKDSKLAPSARTKIVEYDLGPHTFTADSQQACMDMGGLLPKPRAQVLGSVWTAQLDAKYAAGGPAGPDDIVYPVPGFGESGDSQYRVYVQAGDGPSFLVRACVVLASGPGEPVQNVRIIRTVPTMQGIS